MTEQELYDMKLHEEYKNDNDAFLIRRVLGGWIYAIISKVGISMVFVPEQSMESGMINPDDKAPEAYRFVE